MSNITGKSIKIIDDKLYKLFSIPISQGKWTFNYCFKCSYIGLTCVNKGYSIEKINDELINKKICCSRIIGNNYCLYYNGSVDINKDGLFNIFVNFNVEFGSVEINNFEWSLNKVD